MRLTTVAPRVAHGAALVCVAIGARGVGDARTAVGIDVPGTSGGVVELSARIFFFSFPTPRGERHADQKQAFHQRLSGGERKYGAGNGGTEWGNGRMGSRL